MLKVFAALMLIGVVAGRVCRPYDTARLREAVEAECKKYGAEDHVDEVTDGVLTFADCFSKSIDKEALARLEGPQMPDVNDELVRFVRTSCKNQAKINTCFNNMADAISPCTDPVERSKIDVSKQSWAEMTDLFCKDDSKSFAEFINDGALSCMEDQLYSLVSCMNYFQTLQNRKTLSTAEACNKVGEVITCTVKALETCPKPSTANFVKTLFKTLSKGSSCTNLNGEENKIAVNAI